MPVGIEMLMLGQVWADAVGGVSTASATMHGAIRPPCFSHRIMREVVEHSLCHARGSRNEPGIRRPAPSFGQAVERSREGSGEADKVSNRPAQGTGCALA